MTQMNSPVGTKLFISHITVNIIIENHTILQQLHHRRSFMAGCFYQYFLRNRHLHIERTSEERSSRPENEFCRNERIFHRSIRRRFSNETSVARRGILAFRQTVYLIIHQDHIDIHIPTYRMNKMVPTDSQTVAISRNLPYRQIGIGRLHPGSHSCGTTMNRMKTIGIHIIRQTRRTADTRNHHRFVGRHSQCRHSSLQHSHDRMVSTTRTPTYILVAFKILCRIFLLFFHILFLQKL